MMSRELLTRIGVFTVALGLTAAPLAFADSHEKEGMNGEYGQSDQTTMQDDATNSTANGTANDTASDAANDSDEVSNDPTEAGGAGIEGQAGTQSGEEPTPEDEADTQTQ